MPGQLEEVLRSFNTDRENNFPFLPTFSAPFTYTSLQDTTSPFPTQHSATPSTTSTTSTNKTLVADKHSNTLTDKDLPAKPLLTTRRLPVRKRFKFWVKNQTPKFCPVKCIKKFYSSSWPDDAIFSRFFMYLCRLWLIVALAALVMPLIVWIMIFIENTKTFSNTMHHYLGNDQSVYDEMDGDSDAGYVGNTNIPKHLGGVVFAAVFDISMWVMIILSACADFFWRFPIAKRIINAFHAQGLYDEKSLVDVEFFYLVANCFFKLFIVAATGSQTYTGLYPDNKHVDTPLFCLYATMILLGSIPFTLIALFFVLHEMKRAEYAKAAAGKA